MYIPLALYINIIGVDIELIEFIFFSADRLFASLNCTPEPQFVVGRKV